MMLMECKECQGVNIYDYKDFKILQGISFKMYKDEGKKIDLKKTLADR